MSRVLTDYRRKYLRFAVTERRRNLKLEAIQYKGGICIRCGYNKCPGALTFHHINPNEKDFGIASNGNIRSLEKLKPELDKCILLCHNCHAELHAEEYDKVRQEKIIQLATEKHITPKRSLTKKCSNCSKIITVYASYNTSNNYCSRKCRDAHQNNLGWIADEELLQLRQTMSVKDIASKLEKSPSRVYDRLKRFLSRVS
jgi:endogenous inhibitor of DNA gyrase (YacG/DUF329 family)